MTAMGDGLRGEKIKQKGKRTYGHTKQWGGFGGER